MPGRQLPVIGTSQRSAAIASSDANKPTFSASAVSIGNPDEDIISDLSSASPDEDFDPDEAVKNTQQSW